MSFYGDLGLLHKMRDECVAMVQSVFQPLSSRVDKVEADLSSLVISGTPDVIDGGPF